VGLLCHGEVWLVASVIGDAGRMDFLEENAILICTPLVHIGRVCPVDTDVHGASVKAVDLVSLCWASANFDETVFEIRRRRCWTASRIPTSPLAAARTSVSALPMRG
jgi:hypothetical protein